MRRPSAAVQRGGGALRAPPPFVGSYSAGAVADAAAGVAAVAAAGAAGGADGVFKLAILLGFYTMGRFFALFLRRISTKELTYCTDFPWNWAKI